MIGDYQAIIRFCKLLDYIILGLKANMSRGEEKDGGWDEINFDDIELGEIIGGGGAGVIYMAW